MKMPAMTLEQEMEFLSQLALTLEPIASLRTQSASLIEIYLQNGIDVPPPEFLPEFLTEGLIDAETHACVSAISEEAKVWGAMSYPVLRDFGLL